jgi:hypothetical protein
MEESIPIPPKTGSLAVDGDVEMESYKSLPKTTSKFARADTPSSRNAENSESMSMEESIPIPSKTGSLAVEGDVEMESHKSLPKTTSKSTRADTNHGEFTSENCIRKEDESS